MSKKIPTREQRTALDHAVEGNSAELVYVPGGGKSFMLGIAAEVIGKPTLLTTFTKQATASLRSRMPRNVTVSTAHALANKYTSAYYDRAKLVGSFNVPQIEKTLRPQPIPLPGGRTLTSRDVAALIRDAERQFCTSADIEVDESHVLQVGRLAVLSNDEFADVAGTIAQHAQRLWEMRTSPTGSIPFGHDGYLKFFQLNDPTLPCELLLVDECYDFNPVVADIIVNQDCQIILAGDPNQQIYTWRGGGNHYAKLNAKVFEVTKSYRFGPTIATHANLVLRSLGQTIQIEGNPDAPSLKEQPAKSAGTILTRTNATAICEVMSHQSVGFNVHILGGKTEPLRLMSGVQQLRAGQRTSVSEFMGYQDWADVVRDVEDGNAPELEALTRLVHQHGEDQIINALEKTDARERDACTIVGTAHKSKGRQWPIVTLVDDFLSTRSVTDRGENESIDSEEKRLVYVAETRAEQFLGVPAKITEKISEDVPQVAVGNVVPFSKASGE